MASQVSRKNFCLGNDEIRIHLPVSRKSNPGSDLQLKPKTSLDCGLSARFPFQLGLVQIDAVICSRSAALTISSRGDEVIHKISDKSQGTIDNGGVYFDYLSF